jgi:23S rRNA (cytidine1920-2'-O)/16S rRNA (cytidine1409-2'-O)-methyltransferase
MRYAAEAPIEVRAGLPYVSRGGLKLAHGIARFAITVRGLVCADVGASTGGFTDVLLQNGAARVYAIDVGYGQLDWKIRSDPRVVVMDRTNIRDVKSLPEPIDFACVDVSFISLALVLPVALRLLSANGALIALVKPQFEAGKDQVGKGGVVREPAIWRAVLSRLLAFCAGSDWDLCGLCASPLKGASGNVEFLLHLRPRGGCPSRNIEAMVDDAIREAEALP